MAWYLTSAPAAGSKYISVNIPASTLNAGRPLQIEWEIEFEAARFQNDFPVSSDSNSSGNTLVFLRTGSDFEFRSVGNPNWVVTTGLTLSNFNKFRLRSTFDGTTHAQELYVNGGSTPIATRNPTTAAIGAQAALLGLANSTRAGGLKYYKFTDFVTPANNRHYDASASGGVGTILPDIINSANNGTQVGTWPSDNSEWVFYSSGATYQLTAQGGTFTYSGQTAALNRGFKLAAQGGTYSYTGASANLSYTTATIYRLDALGASYSYAGASASLLRDFKLTAQGGAYNYSGSDAVLRRGFKLAANGSAYSYAGADASLTYVAGPTVYHLTALGVTYVYSGADAALTATGVAPAANPNAFHITAQISGSQNISAMIGGTLTNNAKIGGNMTISARLSQ